MVLRRLSAGLILLLFITVSQLVNAQDATADSDLPISTGDTVTAGEDDAVPSEPDKTGQDEVSKEKKGAVSKQRVAILDLYDATGNPEYAYLKSLISDSIRLNLSLDEEGVADVVELVEKDIVRQHVVREKLRGKFIWKDQVKKAAGEFAADLVTSGYYSLKEEKIVIHLQVYSSKHDAYTIQITEESLIDYTLIDKIREISLKFIQLMQKEYSAPGEKEHKPRLLIFNYLLEGSGVDEYAELMELLKGKIEGHNIYEVVDRKDVLELLTLLGIKEESEIPESLVLRIARYFGADIIVTGSIEKNVGVVKINTAGISSASGGELLQTVNTITGRDDREKVMEELADYICFGEKTVPLIEEQEEEEIVASEEEEIVEETEEIKREERVKRERALVHDVYKKKTGFVLTSFGAASIAFGGGLLAFERLYMNPRIMRLKQSPSYENEKELFNRMLVTDYIVFTASLGAMAIGTGMLIPGLVLMLKYRDNQMIKNKYDRFTIALFSSAAGFLTTGATMLLFDRLAMGPLVRNAKDDSGQYLKYDEYQELYYSDVSLFSMGIGFLAAGGAFLTPAIIRLAARRSKNFTDKLKVSDMIGYTFLFTGISSMLGGGSLFLFDRTYISYKLLKFRSYAQESAEYDEYLRYYNINTPLFISSIGLMGLGALLSIISIPFIIGETKLLNKKGKAQIQLEIGYREDLAIALSCKF